MPTATPSKPRSMSAHHVRWYTRVRSPSTDVAIMPPRGLWKGRAFQPSTWHRGRWPPEPREWRFRWRIRRRACARSFAPAALRMTCGRAPFLEKEMGCHPMITGIAIPRIEHSQDSDRDGDAEHRGEQADASVVFDEVGREMQARAGRD